MRLIERDVTPAELELMRRGFEEHQQEQGIPFTSQERHTVVAMDGDRFIGCASGLTDHHWFHLTDMWLEKAYRRKGLGTALLIQLEARVADAGIANIYTWTAGFEAPGFYRRLGYQAFCELEGYYAAGSSRFGFRKGVAPLVNTSPAT